MCRGRESNPHKELPLLVFETNASAIPPPRLGYCNWRLLSYFTIYPLIRAIGWFFDKLLTTNYKLLNILWTPCCLLSGRLLCIRLVFL